MSCAACGSRDAKLFARPSRPDEAVIACSPAHARIATERKMAAIGAPQDGKRDWNAEKRALERDNRERKLRADLCNDLGGLLVTFADHIDISYDAGELLPSSLDKMRNVRVVKRPDGRIERTLEFPATEMGFNLGTIERILFDIWKLPENAHPYPSLWTSRVGNDILNEYLPYRMELIDVYDAGKVVLHKMCAKQRCVDEAIALGDAADHLRKRIRQVGKSKTTYNLAYDPDSMMSKLPRDVIDILADKAYNPAIRQPTFGPPSASSSASAPAPVFSPPPASSSAPVFAPPPASSSAPVFAPPPASLSTSATTPVFASPSASSSTSESPPIKITFPARPFRPLP